MFINVFLGKICLPCPTFTSLWDEKIATNDHIYYIVTFLQKPSYYFFNFFTKYFVKWINASIIEALVSPEKYALEEAWTVFTREHNMLARV